MKAWLAKTFLYPWALVLLAVPTVLVFVWMLLERRRRRTLEALGGVQGLVSDPAGRRRVRMWLWLFAVNLLGLGVAGPIWGRDESAPPSQGRDIVVVLDVSRSMLAEAEPNRLTRARSYLLDFADLIQRRGGYRLGLVVFAGKAKMLCPLTEDIEHFRYAVLEAHPYRLGPGGRLDSPADDEPVAYGTWLRQALIKAVQTHEKQYRGYQEIILLSDGDDLPGDWRLALDAVRAARIPVYTVGIGEADAPHKIPTGDENEPYLREDDPETGERKLVWTKRNDATLREIADEGGGQYYPEESSPYPLVHWFESRIAHLPPRELVEDERYLHHPRYSWFFAAALAFLCFEMLLAETGQRRRMSG